MRSATRGTARPVVHGAAALLCLALTGPGWAAQCPQQIDTNDCVANDLQPTGTEIIKELGEESVATGKPILYTSADSVFQIAAHEEAFGLDRLLKLCEDLAPTLHAMKVGRVIARLAEAFGRVIANRKRRRASRDDSGRSPDQPGGLKP